MGTILKVAALLLVIGGLWVWTHDHSVTRAVVDATETARSGSLAASAILAPVSAQGAFDEEGSIIIDSGTPYILYTAYTAQGRPKVMTKRLVFRNQDECADLNLPCATKQPGPPVSADEKVRIVGIVSDEMVEVTELYRL